MESLSFENLEIIHETLLNIRKSISMLLEWNVGVQSTDEWTDSPSGMQKLAANCMLIEAIGEAIRKIEKRASREFLNQRPEIPWQDVMSMRNHIAHGYFDLDDSYVLSVIQNDLKPLAEAIDFLIEKTKLLIIEKEVDEGVKG
ncbi:MAG: DUF86 domain-containing protein [Paludibacteraceae bacterium]|nr:DUF86 domain-containing protein [Paludibacteraceae bacterium]MBQ6984254.1 DUF86 domain-containing protein [Paludibacteraceae bacterium]